MTTKKYTSKINKANSTNDSLKCTIPKQIVDQLQITSEDILKWIILENGTIQVEKVEL